MKNKRTLGENASQNSIKLSELISGREEKEMQTQNTHKKQPENTFFRLAWVRFRSLIPPKCWCGSAHWHFSRFILDFKTANSIFSFQHHIKKWLINYCETTTKNANSIIALHQCVGRWAIVQTCDNLKCNATQNANVNCKSSNSKCWNWREKKCHLLITDTMNNFCKSSFTI